MPRPKRGSPEAKAWGVQMREARRAKQILAAPSIPSDQDESDLIKQIKELKDNQELLKAALLHSGPQVTDRGVIGTREKYRLDPDLYPDPRERLAEQEQFKRLAFSENWELDWAISPTRYQTVDGIWQTEPRFTLKLIKIIFDDKTYEKTNRRYVARQLIMHEDPEAAVVIAREQGLPVDEKNELNFLNEMRFIRMRDWLIETFFPPPTPINQNKRQVVIDNQLVELYEITSESKESIPFDKIGTFKNG